MQPKTSAPAEVLQDLGRSAQSRFVDFEFTSRKSKRKLGNVWLESDRYLFRSGPNGSTGFDTLKWTCEPLQRRRA